MKPSLLQHMGLQFFARTTLRVLIVKLVVLWWNTRFSAPAGVSNFVALGWMVVTYSISFIAYSEIWNILIKLTWRPTSSRSACNTGIAPVGIWIGQILVSSVGWSVTHESLAWWETYLLVLRRNASISGYLVPLGDCCLQWSVDFANHLHIGAVGWNLSACTDVWMC